MATKTGYREDSGYTWSRKPVINFKKGLHNTSKYNDPTYLGFLLLFDWNTPLEHSSTGGSPLLAGGIDENAAGTDPESWHTKPGTAMDYLKRCGEFQRMVYLNAFINTLKSINYNMPWYWQELEGLTDAWKHDDMKDPYVGGDESLIKIKTLESIDLIVTNCMDLYQYAIYDWDNRRIIVPENLRKFSVDIYVQEIRKFQLDEMFLKKLGESSVSIPGEEGFSNTSIGGKSSDAMTDINKGQNDPSNPVNNFFSNPESEEFKYINQGGARVKFGFDFCEWKTDASTVPFATLNMGSPVMATQEIQFSYENLRRTSEYPGLQTDLQNQSGNVGNTSTWKKDLKNKGKDIAANTVNQATEYAKGKINGLLLGNVYGFSAGNIGSALEQGTIQSLSKEVGKVASKFKKDSDDSRELSGRTNVYE